MLKHNNTIPRGERRKEKEREGRSEAERERERDASWDAGGYTLWILPDNDGRRGETMRDDGGRREGECVGEKTRLQR